MIKKQFAAGVLYRTAAVFFTVMLLLHPSASYDGAVRGMLMWYQNILPVQLPFFIAIRLMRDTGGFLKMAYCLEPLIRRVFHLPGEAAMAILAGWISGYPTGGQMALRLYQEKKISAGQYMHLACFCNLPGPLFVITTVGIRFLKDGKLGYILLISQWMAAILYGILFRSRKSLPSCEKTVSVHKAESLGWMLKTAIDESAETVVMIGGFVTLFSVILSWIPSCWFTAGIEMTNGCAMLAMLPSGWNVVWIGFLLGWGGLCVNLQIVTALKEGPDIFGKLWGYRIFLGILAGGISGILAGFANL